MVRPLHALEWIRAQQYQCKALSWHRINSLQDIKLTVWFLDSQEGSYFIKNVFLPKSQNIRISPDRLWKPDILLYNSASADFYGAYQRFDLFSKLGITFTFQLFDSLQWWNCWTNSSRNLSIHLQGWKKRSLVFWNILLVQVDMTWFPFDEQICDLKFGTWTNHESLVIKSNL